MIAPGSTNRVLLVVVFVVVLLNIVPALQYYPLSVVIDDGPIVNDDFPKNHYFTELFRQNTEFPAWGEAWDPNFFGGYISNLGNATCQLFLLITRLLPFADTDTIIKVTVFLLLLFLPGLFAFAGALFTRRLGVTLAAGIGGMILFYRLQYALFWVGNATSVFMMALAIVTGAWLYRMLDRERLAYDTAILFFLCAVAFWIHPLFPFYFLPLFIIVMIAGRRSVTQRRFLAIALAGVGAVAVNLPWVIPFVLSYRKLNLQRIVDNTLDLSVKTGQSLSVPLGIIWADVLHVVLLTAAIIGAVLLAYRNRKLFIVLAAAAIGYLAMGPLIIKFAPWLYQSRSVLMVDNLLMLLAVAGLSLLFVRDEGMQTKFPLIGHKRWAAVSIVGGILILAGVGAFLAGLPMTVIRQIVPFSATPTTQQAGVMRWVEDNTDNSARILFEDVFAAGLFGYRYVLPVQMRANRQFIGGPASDNQVIANKINFSVGYLADRPIETFSDDQIDAFLENYNIGWVCAFSPIAIAYFNARPDRFVPDGSAEAFHFYRVPMHSGYFAKGSGRVVAAAVNKLELVDLTPEEGEVVLRYHYARGMVTEPPVELARFAVDGDPQDFIRLVNPPGNVIIKYRPGSMDTATLEPPN
ncbi:MAG TPA: hypothetical protein PKW95_04390 [bacterium]|nr:hypothetical protein [bacterium]